MLLDAGTLFAGKMVGVWGREERKREAEDIRPNGWGGGRSHMVPKERSGSGRAKGKNLQWNGTMREMTSTETLATERGFKGRILGVEKKIGQEREKEVLKGRILVSKKKIEQERDKS